MSKLTTTKAMMQHLVNNGSISTQDVPPSRRRALVQLIYYMTKHKGYKFEQPERNHLYGGRDWHITYKLK